MTPRFAHLDWPFFDGHGKLALDADAWARDALGDWVHDPDADAVCRRLVGAMGSAGWLRYAVGNGEGGDTLDRALRKRGAQGALPAGGGRRPQHRGVRAFVIFAPGEGFKVAMRALDVFRTTVAAAALLRGAAA